MPFPCNVCKSVFYRQRDLNCHRAAVHNVKQQFACGTCLKTFDCASTLYRHPCSIPATVYKCGYKGCQYKVQSRNLLKQHFDRVHLRTLEVKCYLCGRCFSQRYNLKRHLMLTYCVGLKEVKENLVPRKDAFSFGIVEPKTEPKKCPQSSYCPEGASGDRKPCERGTFGAATGLKTQDGCADCPAEKCCAVAGLKDPTSKATQKNPTDGTTGNSCGLGTYCEKGSEKATVCDAGTYNDEQKQGACKPCPTEGTSTPKPCPAGSSTDQEVNSDPADGKYCEVADETGESDCDSTGSARYTLANITLSDHDLMTLDKEQYLNDAIVSCWLASLAERSGCNNSLFVESCFLFDHLSSLTYTQDKLLKLLTWTLLSRATGMTVGCSSSLLRTVC